MSGRGPGGSGPHFPDWDDDPHSLENMQRKIMEHNIKMIEREEKAEADQKGQEGGKGLPPPPVVMMRMRKPTRIEVIYGYLRYWMPVFRDMAIVILVGMILWKGW